MEGLFNKIVKRTLRVPATLAGDEGEGQFIARQLDAALMSVGFKLSKEILETLSLLHPVVVREIGARTLEAVRELVGDSVEHNMYFREFPNNIPDTMEFWLQCIVDALHDPRSQALVFVQLSYGRVNLLDLPKYGSYQHSYQEMLAAHEQFIPSAKDRITLLHLGGTLPGEGTRLYHSLASSPIPLNEGDKELLAELASVHLYDINVEIPMRENRALINCVRVQNERIPLVDTPTDILRLAAALSGGDLTLETNTKFKSLPRSQRRMLMMALNQLVLDAPAKLADVNQYNEKWKRLGEYLHPHEYPRLKHAQDVFKVARGEKTVRSLAAKVELAFADGDIPKVISLLSVAPGMLFRNLDRILRANHPPETEARLLETIPIVIERVSGRVIISVTEHLLNRGNTIKTPKRIFANSKGKAWVAPDTRTSLEPTLVAKLVRMFDEELAKRVLKVGHLVVDAQVAEVSLPLSEKNRASGFNVMPRGSVQPVENSTLRFFMHWKQKDRRTDYDLSALMLNEKFEYVGHLSYTQLRAVDGVHSGDITSAPNGASEFIDINLRKVRCKYVIPQVHIFDGEDFLEAEESSFGFMTLEPEQEGKPFEARAVRTKAEVRGKGRVALPLVFIKHDDGQWEAKWLNLYLNGKPKFNQVESNRVSTTLLARAIIEREYAGVWSIIRLMNEDSFEWYEGQAITGEPVTFIGLEAPESLPAGSKVITLNNLHELIPA